VGNLGGDIVNFPAKHPIEKMMDNPWVSKTLAAYSKPASVRRPPAPDGQLDVGGPIPVAVWPREDTSLVAAFYDQETDILSVNILPFEPYDSYVESDDVRIDADQGGRPVFIEVSRPWSQWRIDPDFSLPEADFDGTINLRETLRRFPSGEIIADRRRETVCLKFLARQGDRVIRLAENMLAETADEFLVGFWLAGVQPDFAGRKQSLWRAATAARLRKSGKSWNPCTRTKLSQNSL
jgi:hypothetical protein